MFYLSMYRDLYFISCHFDSLMRENSKSRNKQSESRQRSRYDYIIKIFSRTREESRTQTSRAWRENSFHQTAIRFKSTYSVAHVLTRIVYLYLSIASERKEMLLRLQPRERLLLSLWLPMWPPCSSRSLHSSRFSTGCYLTWVAWWDTLNSALRQVGLNLISTSLFI